MITYIIIDKTNGEVIQSGSMDETSFEVHPVDDLNHEMVEIPPKHAWKLRGEFTDPETGKPDFIYDVVNKRLKPRPGRPRISKDPVATQAPRVKLRTRKP